MKPLTILFDADDTAENLMDCWTDALNERYGTSVRPEDVTQWDIKAAFPTLAEDQIFGVLTDESLWKRICPMPGSQRVLQKLHEQGHELYIVTASDYRTCKAKAERLLELFPFLDWKHIIFAHNKQMIHGDILIDDGPHNLIYGDYFRILFTRPHNRSFDAEALGMVRADTWDDVDRIVHQFSSSLVRHAIPCLQHSGEL